MQIAELSKQRPELQAAMRGGEGSQAADGLGELALSADPPAPAGLVPGHRDVDEPLEEVTLLDRSRAPGELELLVRGEVLTGADERDTLVKRGLELLRRRPGRRRFGAGSRGRTRSDPCARRTASRARDS